MGTLAGACLGFLIVIYQDPLAYLLGLEGIALLDAWAGDHDRAFTEARLAEIRRLLDDERLRDRGVLVEQVSAATVYEQVSAGYDAEAGGGLFATDEPVVRSCTTPGSDPRKRSASAWRMSSCRPRYTTTNSGNPKIRQTTKTGANCTCGSATPDAGSRLDR